MTSILCDYLLCEVLIGIEPTPAPPQGRSTMNYKTYGDATGDRTRTLHGETW